MYTHLRRYYPILISSFILITGCKKRDEKAPVLPEATQEGKNTIGFEVDGQVWIPYYQCRFGGNACGELEAGYGLPLVPETGFVFHANRRTDRLSTLSVTVKPGATITGTGDKTDSVRVVYTSESWAGSTLPGRFIGPLAGSRFVVTKLDRQAKIISGTFDLAVADSVDAGSRKTLSGGRFDFQFYTCRCSN